GLWVWVFDLMSRRRREMSGAVAVPDSIREAEQNVIQAGAALAGLMKVVAQGEAVGQTLQVGRVSLLHVVKLHSGRSLAGGKEAGGRGRGAARPITACPDRDFHPGK